MKNFACLICFFFSLWHLEAQEGHKDSSAADRAAVYAKQMYDSRRADESSLYNGIQFYPYLASIEGIAFFQSPNWQTGSLIYDNIRYDNISLKFDMVKEQVVVAPDKEGGLYISLFSPRVKEFSFAGIKFVRLGKPGDGSGLPEGFYQQLVSGKLTALARKTKTIVEWIVDQTIMRRFDSITRYYVQKDSVYHPIMNASDLFDLVKDRKKEVQQFLSSRKLKYRREPEKTIISAIEFYNQPAN